MARTVSDILEKIGAYVDQDTDLPDEPELSVRISYIDDAQDEWAGAYTWEALRTKGSLSATSGASYGLPTDFRDLMSPVFDVTLDDDNEYPEVKPADRFKKASTDKYCYIVGDTITINPPPTSAASLLFDYQKIPTALVSTNQISPIPRPEYLVKRGIAYVLESRSDTRFPQVKEDSQIMLDRMIEEEDVPSGGQLNRVPDWQRSQGFTLGED